MHSKTPTVIQTARVIKRLAVSDAVKNFRVIPLKDAGINLPGVGGHRQRCSNLKKQKLRYLFLNTEESC